MKKKETAGTVEGLAQNNAKPHRPWFKKKRLIVPLGLLILTFGIATSQAKPSSDKDTALVPSSSGTPQALSSETPEEQDYSDETVSQREARESAENYLSYMAFSRSGLIDQLKFESFSKTDATYAVDVLNVDWNEQAAIKSEDYLGTLAFSRAGLIDQLKFDGFTTKQATYGVDKTNTDWNEQAALKAEDYLSTMAFSRKGLIDQLKFDGFTTKQATYGVDQAGL